MLNQNKTVIRNTIIAASLLVFAYILRIILRRMDMLIPPTVLTIVRNLIHESIVILWAISLRRRVVNKQVSRMLFAVGLLMAMWLIAKNVKYEFFPNNVVPAVRYL